MNLSMESDHRPPDAFSYGVTELVLLVTAATQQLSGLGSSQPAAPVSLRGTSEAVGVQPGGHVPVGFTGQT